MKTLIKNGNIVFFDKIEKADVLIQDGVIAKIEPNIRDIADEVIDATGKCLIYKQIEDKVYKFEFSIMDDIIYPEYMGNIEDFEMEFPIPTMPNNIFNFEKFNIIKKENYYLLLIFKTRYII